MTRHMLLIASGKGGVGTSVVTALIALAAAQRRMRVLLVDASESGGGGTQHHLFGVRPAHSLWMLTDPRSRPDDAIIALDDMLTLVAGVSSGTAVGPSTDNERRAALARLAGIYDRFDLVLFDGGSRLDTITAISELADPALLLVTSADRLALAANYALVKSVHLRGADTPVSVVSNRHGEALAEEACDFLTGACSHFLGRRLTMAGSVPDDPCLLAAVGAGMTVRDAADGSPAAEAIGGVLSHVVPTAPAAALTGSPSLLSPFSSRRWS